MDVGEIWDGIVDELDYFVHFEWVSDVGEFFSGFFENVWEFNPFGVIYGIIVVLLVYLFRGSVFVMVHNPILQIFFYIFAFIIGYLSGKRVWG